MPEPVDLGYALKLPPRRVIEYFRSKGYEFSWDWREVWQAEHARAFTVAKAARQDVLSTLHGAVDKALAEGQTLRQFTDELEPKLRSLGWWGRRDGVQLGSPHRLKTIFRTNVRVAYSSAQYRHQAANARSRPYWQYLAILDERTRPAHAELHGMVFRHDDPFWDTFYPPNDWHCRCMVRALTERELADRGLAVSDSRAFLDTVDRPVATDSRTGEVTMRPASRYIGPGSDGELVSVTLPPEWSYNPGKASTMPVPPGGIRGVLPGAPFQPSWSTLGLPAALPVVSPARPRRITKPRPGETETQAREREIREAIEVSGGTGIAITRDDGVVDRVYHRVPAPADLDDVTLTESFVQYVARTERRTEFADRILPTLTDPGEVWLKKLNRDGRVVYRRVFLSAHADYDTLVVAQEDKHGWLSWNFYPVSDMNNRRRGFLLYRREEAE